MGVPFATLGVHMCAVSLHQLPPVQYASTLKLMQIMDEKGLVVRDTSSKTHVYRAAYSQEKAQSSALDKILSTVFEGSTSDLVIQALGHHKASKDEIDAIKKYLDQFGK